MIGPKAVIASLRFSFLATLIREGVIENTRAVIVSVIEIGEGCSVNCFLRKGVSLLAVTGKRAVEIGERGKV